MASLLRTLPSSTASSSSRLAPSSPVLAGSRRSVHRLAKYHFDPLKDHGRFLGKNTLKRVAVDYQQGLLDRLNDQVRSSMIEHFTVFETMKKTAADPSQALTFQYASSAFNNHFFLHGLSSPLQPETQTWNAGMEYLIIRDFGTVADFALALQDAVAAMPTSGHLWLVQKVKGDEHHLAIEATYGSGSIMTPARLQQQGSLSYVKPADAALPELPVKRPQTPKVVEAAIASAFNPRDSSTKKYWESEESHPASTFVPPFSSTFDEGRSSSPSSVEEAEEELTPYQQELARLLARGPNQHKSAGTYHHKYDEVIHPLACLSVHERVYLQDYGFGGKEEFVRAWLAAVDWNKIWQNTTGRMDTLKWSPIAKSLQDRLMTAIKPAVEYR